MKTAARGVGGRVLRPGSRNVVGPGRLRRQAAGSIGAAAAFVAWAGLAAVANRHWYAGLLKPFFAPAPWLAALLLGVAAASIGGALFRVLRSPDYHPDRLRAMRTILTVLAIAAVWVWAFFVGRHPTLSLAFAAALVLGSGLALWRAAAVDRRAALLLVGWTACGVLVALVDLSVRLRNG